MVLTARPHSARSPASTISFFCNCERAAITTELPHCSINTYCFFDAFGSTRYSDHVPSKQLLNIPAAALDIMATIA